MRVGIGPFPLERASERALPSVYERAFELAARAEGAGLDAVWVDGNHFTAQSHGPSPLIAAAALAAHTRRVRIGVATLTLPLAGHPLQVAEEALLLDALSGGRLVLGVGLGYRPEEFAGFGVDLADRRSRFDEGLRVLRDAFAERDVGERGIVAHPRPIRPGGPPIWVGGGWQPAAVRRVARLGLPLISQFFESPARIDEKRRRYLAAAAPDAPGRTIVPAIRDVAITGRADDVAAEAALQDAYRRYAGWGMPLLERPTRPGEIGPKEVREIALIGSPDEVRARLDALASAGVTDLLARIDLPGIPDATTDRTLDFLSDF